ncbi:MAG: choice-of-anchor B family protein [Bacteroidia bacterium]
MKFKKLLFGAMASVAFCAPATAQLNVTFRAQLSYGSQTCANICGYVDTTGKEYALVGASLGMSIVDVSNPSAPVEVLQVPGPDNLWKEIKVRGKYAYVTSEGGGGLQIINMSSLPNTAGVTSTNWAPTISGPGGGTLNTIHALHIDGKYVYLYGSNIFSGGAVVADLTNPTAPVYVGNYRNITSPYVHDGYVRNDTLYAGHIYDGFFSVVDFTNKSAPVELANQNTPNNFTHNTWLSQNSKVLFTTDEKSDSYLTSYDISNLSSIQELDRIQSNPGSNSIVHNTHIINVAGNDYAVTSWYRDGFTITDVGRPQNMIQVGNYDTYPAGSGDGFDGDWGVYPYLPSGTIVVSNIDEGLFVFTPTYVRACYLEGVVSDSTCGALLNNVHVTITAAGVNDSTDLVGQYRTGTPTPGTYNVSYSHSGYITKTLTGIVLSPGVVNIQDVQLAPGSTANVTGTITNSVTTAPVPSALVEISDPVNTYSFVTDASGNFSSCNVVAASDYDVNAGMWGFETYCTSSQTINSGTTSLTYPLAPGYYDDFTFDFGWTVTSTAGTGTWVRGVPLGTLNGTIPANPGADVTTDCSNKAFVTGNTGVTGSDDDVDNGYTTLISPTFDLTSYAVPYLNYSRWFYNGGGSGSPNDSLNVFLSNGLTTVLVESSIVSTPGFSTWIPRSYKVSDYIAPTANMKVFVRTGDNALSGHIVEAGFDRFAITEGPNGIAENKLNGSLKVFPNPFADEASISYELNEKLTGDACILLTDVTGKIAAKYKLGQQAGTVSIDPALANGIYFVKIMNGSEQSMPVKIVKVK